MNAITIFIEDGEIILNNDLRLNEDEARGLAKLLDVSADQLSVSRAQRTGLTERVMDNIVHEIANGRKISAIKLYRSATGEGLKHCKEMVEDLAVVHGYDGRIGV